MSLAVGPESTVLWLACEAGEVPEDDAWLGPRERRPLAGLRFEKRRRDWRLGRWTAKALLAAWGREAELSPGRPHPEPPPPEGSATGPWTWAGLAALEIIAAADGAPEAWTGEDRLPVALSLSHAGDRAVAALAPAALGSGTIALGCDLEQVEPRSRELIADVLTPSERALLEAAPPADQPLLVNLLWSAKESALKALRTGLRRDVRSVEVRLSPQARPTAGWRPLTVQAHGIQPREADSLFHGWWRPLEGGVLTLVASPAPAPPVRAQVETRRLSSGA